ncbi:hypothetical protein EAE96_006857 [Botrytis aclada]|nr:hypothetical protein EAE96_006857 [Botrytis aclada]
MVSKNFFRRRAKGSGKENYDDHDKAPTEGSRPPSKASSRASSRDNRKRSVLASKTPEVPNKGYLKTFLGHFAEMPGLAEDVGILLQKAKKKLERLHELDRFLKGRGQVGTYVNQCTKHLVKAQRIHGKTNEYIIYEEKEVKKEEPVQKEGDATAYEEAFQYAHGCLPETWEIKRIVGENKDDLDLIIARDDALLKSKNCTKNVYNKEVVDELISMSMKLRAAHEEALTILGQDNSQTQRREPRSSARAPAPENTRKVTPRPPIPVPRRN